MGFTSCKRDFTKCYNDGVILSLLTSPETIELQVKGAKP